MIKSYDEAMNILQKLFSDTFMSLYKSTSVAKRKELLLRIQAIYRRWYYSALVESTPLSPANIMDSVSDHFGILPRVYPIAVYKNSSIEYKTIEYTLDNHPIISDLRIFMDQCKPVIKLKDEYSIPFDKACEIATRLSIPDPDYAEFLFVIARSLDLLEKTKSVTNFTTRPSNTSEEFFEQTNKEMLEEIIDATVYMSTINIKDNLPPEAKFFTEKFLLGMLCEPITVDELFSKIFESFGVNISEFFEDLMDMGDESDEPKFEALESMALVYNLGVAYDKFFITPFGTYLRLIKSLYLSVFPMETEVGEFLKLNKNERALDPAFYAPCTVHHLTELGLEFFGFEKTDRNYFSTERNLTFEALNLSIFKDPENISFYIELTRNIMNSLLEESEEDEFEDYLALHKFKVVQSDDKKNWMHITIQSGLTLHDLYEVIIDYFPASKTNAYSLYHDTEPNPFTEYLGPANLKKGKKTRQAKEVIIDDLDFEYKKDMLLVFGRQTKPFSEEPALYKLNISCMGEYYIDDDYDEYPKVNRMSKSMKEGQTAKDTSE